MSIDSYKFWAVPLTLWALYSCWHFGYQSGYSDGHETAWKMYQPSDLARVIASSEQASEFDDAPDADVAKKPLELRDRRPY